MKDERYKKIMKDLGMPNSQSLFCALKQVANETAQEIHEEYKVNNKKFHMEACCQFKNCQFYRNTNCAKTTSCGHHRAIDL